MFRQISAISCRGVVGNNIHKLVDGKLFFAYLNYDSAFITLFVTCSAQQHQKNAASKAYVLHCQLLFDSV
jgi:hypothetical protein